MFFDCVRNFPFKSNSFSSLLLIHSSDVKMTLPMLFLPVPLQSIMKSTVPCNQLITVSYSWPRIIASYSLNESWVVKLCPYLSAGPKIYLDWKSKHCPWLLSKWPKYGKTAVVGCVNKHWKVFFRVWVRVEEDHCFILWSSLVDYAASLPQNTERTIACCVPSDSRKSYLTGKLD